MSQNQSKNIWIASDHAGFQLKEYLKKELPKLTWDDLGPADSSRVDYPDYADRLASQVSQHGGRGILICGSGQGMAMRANRYPGVRAALAWSEESTKLSREHNDANVLALGARLITPELAKNLVTLFLQTSFEGGRHADRVAKIDRPLK